MDGVGFTLGQSLSLGNKMENETEVSNNKLQILVFFSDPDHQTAYMFLTAFRYMYNEDRHKKQKGECAPDIFASVNWL
jgi:hypothetical protein